MICKYIQIAVPNSVVLVMDQSAGEIPDSMNGGIVSASPTCVAIGTASEVDEQVLLELTDTPPDPDTDLTQIHTSRISTPSREVAVCSIYDERLLSTDVPSDVSQIEVWVNHPTEPNRIVVVAR